MKKTVIVLSILLIFAFTMEVEAGDFSTGISGASSIDAGATFTVDLNVNSSSELYGVTGNLSYDNDLLELVSSDAKSGFALTMGTTIVADTASPRSGSFAIATLTFKAKSGFAPGESTTISFRGVEGSDGASTLSGANASRSISVKVPPVPKSSNNNLSSLSVNPGSVNFSKSTTTYNLTVDHDVSTMSIQASAEDSKARVSGAGNKSLSVYGNRFNLVVTAEDGSTKTYTVNVTRRDERGSTAPLSGNANLSRLEVEEYSLEFSPDLLAYSLEVENHVSSINLSASAEHSAAKVEIQKPDTLELGSNMITITVTAENGDTKVYTLEVLRDDSASILAMEDLERALPSMTVKEVIVLQDAVGIIEGGILKSLKEYGKTLIIRAQDEDGKVIYEWIIDGEFLNDEFTAIHTLLSFETEDQGTIYEVANFAQGVILSFAHNPVLPEGTTVRIFVGDHYDEDCMTRLYYFNPDSGELELYDEEVSVEEGYVTLELTHTSQYFLTRATISNQAVNSPVTAAAADPAPVIIERGTSAFLYVSILQLLAIIGLGVYIYQSRRRRHFS